VGDVARFADPVTNIETRRESWRNAEDSAQSVARVLCGGQPDPRDVPWHWTDQHGRNIQVAGWPADDLSLVEHGDAHAGPYIAYFLADSVVRGAIGVDCGREVRSAQQLIRSAAMVDPSSLPGPRTRRSRQIEIA
jgi:3-phenylpropionate/trans-cinnamate dioxygenase ferredoxin reductase subunit